jgi:hypothetical protein
MLTLMGFGRTSLSGVRRGFMPPQLKTKTKQVFDLKMVLSGLFLEIQIKISLMEKILVLKLRSSPFGSPKVSNCNGNSFFLLSFFPPYLILTVDGSANSG